MIEQGKREILDDIAKGTVPADIATFGDLHDYVDANWYGGLFDMETEEGMNLINPLQDALNDWIKGGRK
jgi:hypothetical protein